MASSLDSYLDDLQVRGRLHFSRNEAMLQLGLSAAAFSRAAHRMVQKGRLLVPRSGFYVIVRPEDRALGAPDPARWIDPLMKYLAVDYRISLLRAAAHHGASHQAAMVFQVIAPKQFRGPLVLGRHRVQFIFLHPAIFVATNRAEYLVQLKSEAGFAKAAGIELTLLDSMRYFHAAGGINGVAQIVHDIGKGAVPRHLEKLAREYENASVRRLGYLFEHFGLRRQTAALVSFAGKAKSLKLLDPAVKSLEALSARASARARNSRWMLVVNERIEIDR